MKTYDYLVAYHFSKEGFLTPGTGTIQMSRKTPIKTFGDINEMIGDITKRIDGATNVSIYNYILVGRNEH